jgi:hypothetical protein
LFLKLNNILLRNESKKDLAINKLSKLKKVFNLFI